MAANIITRMVTDTKAHDQGLEKAKASVDKYMKSANSADGITKTLLASFGKYVTVAGAATTAIEVFKDSLMSCESSLDEYNRELEQAKSAYNTFVTALNERSWDGFFERLDKAISKARDLYNIMDKAGSMRQNNSVLIATTENQIAELKRRKKNGENVDSQLKAAQNTLIGLKTGQSDMDKSAGERGFKTTLTGRGVDERVAGSFFNMWQKQGQGAFDYLDESMKIFTMIEASGGKLTETQKAAKEQFKMILDAESALKESQDMYVRGVVESTQAITQAAATDKVLRSGGSGSKSGGSGSKSGGKAPEAAQFIDYTPQGLDLSGTMSINTLKQDLSKWRKAYEEAGDADGRAYAKKMIASVSESIELIKNENNPFEGLIPQLDIPPVENPLPEQAKDTSEQWQAAAQAMGNVGSALNQMEDPGLKVAGIMAQAIANLMLAYTTATMQASKLGPVAWIAAATAGLATVLSTVSALKSANQFAEGGVVGGSSFEGDRLYARVNSGETILNTRQAGLLNQALDNRGGGGSVVRGEDIILAVNNTAKRKGLGELVFG